MMQPDIPNERKLLIWKEIVETVKAESEKQENEITLQEFMELSGISNHFIARTRLDKLVREGKLTKRIVPNPNGGRMALYKPTK